MKIGRTKRRNGSDLILEITPMIDVVFLLLIFFMLATTFDMKAAFKIDLPKSTLQKNINRVEEIQIYIDKNKDIFLEYKKDSKKNSEKVGIDDLKGILSEKLAKSDTKGVIVSADKGLDYGYVVEIMGIIKEAGADAINLDTATKG